MSVEIKLEAKGTTEEKFLEYLQENASEALAEKINGGKKTLAAAWKYVEGEARKELNGRSGCVEDATVYGWVMHYFEDVEEEEEKSKRLEVKNNKGTTEQKTVKPEAGMTEFEKLFGGEE